MTMHTRTEPSHHVRLRLGEGLYRRLGHLAVDRGVPVGELLREAVELLLERHGPSDDALAPGAVGAGRDAAGRP
jgi:hypothetical protein